MPRLQSISLLIICLLAFLIAYRGFMVEPFRVVVRHVTVTGTDLSKVFRGKRVAVVSDLHLGSEEAGSRLLAIFKGISPDYLFLLGDYVQWGGEYAPALGMLSKFPNSVKVFCVLGDYDHYDSRLSCLFCHEQGRGTSTANHAVTFLMNQEVMLHEEGGAFRVVGLDKGSDVEAPALKSPIPTLVLAHDPLMFDLLKGDEGVLMLAGDTHGGQVPLPSFLWRLLGYEKNARYNQGWFAKGSNRLFVTSGVGTSHIRFRLFCQPEVVVMHFQ